MNIVFSQRGPLYEACKWIVCKKVDHDRYSLLNENDVAALLLVKLLCFDGFRHSVAISVIILFLLMFTFDMQMYWSLPDRKPYLVRAPPSSLSSLPLRSLRFIKNLVHGMMSVTLSFLFD